jgi:hypothetical protein
MEGSNDWNSLAKLGDAANMTNPATDQKFSVRCSDFIRMIRLRRTKLNLWNNHHFSISSFEIFGSFFCNLAPSTLSHPIDFGRIRRFLPEFKAERSLNRSQNILPVQIPVK